MPTEVEQLEEQSKTNMAKQTRWALKCFNYWCQDKGAVINFKTVQTAGLQCSETFIVL